MSKLNELLAQDADVKELEVVILDQKTELAMRKYAIAHKYCKDHSDDMAAKAIRTNLKNELNNLLVKQNYTPEEIKAMLIV